MQGRPVHLEKTHACAKAARRGAHHTGGRRGGKEEDERERNVYPMRLSSQSSLDIERQYRWFEEMRRKQAHLLLPRLHTGEVILGCWERTCLHLKDDSRSADSTCVDVNSSTRHTGETMFALSSATHTVYKGTGHSGISRSAGASSAAGLEAGARLSLFVERTAVIKPFNQGLVAAKSIVCTFHLGLAPGPELDSRGTANMRVITRDYPPGRERT